VYVLLALDIILQIAVLVVATDPTLKDGLDEISGARCWSVYSSATRTLDGITGDLEMILVFGGFEMAVVILAAIAAIIDRVRLSPLILLQNLTNTQIRRCRRTKTRRRITT
jgi:hypothetical protein